MASIEDRWFYAKPGPDGGRVKKPRHGTGKRWKVHYDDPEGRQRSESFAKSADASRFKTSVEADVLRGQYVDPEAGTITLRRYAEDVWFPMQTFSESTRERVESRLRLHILGTDESPQLGGYRLAELAKRPSVIQTWLRGLQNRSAKPLEASHIGLVLGTLSSVMASAVIDERISRNPCRLPTVKAPKPPRRKLVPWEVGRVATIREALPGRWRAMTDAGSGAGLRQGEVFGLSPDDIDWLRQIIHVRRQVKLVGGRRVFGPPKGGRDRDVPLAGALALTLSAHLAEHPASRVTLPWEKPRGRNVAATLMFTAADGGAIWRNDWNRYVWHPALRAVGVTPSRVNGFHQLRHHYASVLLSEGVDIRALAEYLGHSDPGFTLRVYTHLMPSAPERARDAIDRAFRARPDCPMVAHGAETGS